MNEQIDLAKTTNEITPERAKAERTAGRRVTANLAPNQARSHPEKQNTAARKTLAEMDTPKPRPNVAPGPSKFLAKVDMNELRGMQGYNVQSDLKYLDKTKQFFDEPGRAARALEAFFCSGITTGAWLGNLRMTNTGTKVDFSVIARDAAEYDDKRNRIDAFATLNFGKDFRQQNPSLPERLVLGFDVTTNGSEGTILNKLTKSYNGNTPLPFGFSEIKYYKYGEQKRQVPLVPRYLIGLSGGDVDAIGELTQTGSNGRQVNTNWHHGSNLYTRFKVLSEMKAENELYLAMLPEQQDSKMLQDAHANLAAMDKFLRQALAQCTGVIMRANALPSRDEDAGDVAGAVAKAQSTAEATQIIEDFVMKRGRGNFKRETQEREARGRFWKTDDGQDTFVQIMDCCRELTKVAQAGKLESLRGVAVHNQPLTRRELNARKTARRMD